MARMENLDTELAQQQSELRAQKSAEGGMTADDLFIQGGHYASLFCIGFAFLAPSLLLWRVVF